MCIHKCYFPQGPPGCPRMRDYLWKVAHAWLDGLADQPFCSSHACVTIYMDIHAWQGSFHRYHSEGQDGRLTRLYTTVKIAREITIKMHY